MENVYFPGEIILHSSPLELLFLALDLIFFFGIIGRGLYILGISLVTRKFVKSDNTKVALYNWISIISLAVWIFCVFFRNNEVILK